MATDFNGVVLGPTPAGIPHLTIPFAINDSGSAATVQQDTEPEIIQSVAMLCGTLPGTRLMIPNYGLSDPTFSGINALELQAQVAKFEQRATVAVVTTANGNEQMVAVEVAGGK